MQQAFYIKDTQAIQDIYIETYPHFMAALKLRKPKAKHLSEDEELCQLHNLTPFVRLGHVRVEDYYDGLILLELSKSGRKLKKP